MIREVIDWKNINFESFKESLSQVPWYVCNTFDEVDDKYWLLQYIYNEIANEHLKKRKAKVKINSLPWINGEGTKLMNKRYTVLIDLKKAFDSVDHSILSSKMDACGLHGKLKDWIQSYLVDRKRFVVIKGKRSGLQIVPYDVPQGSLLRPKLFLIFVNDLPDCLSNGEIHLYSDDTTAIVIGKNEDEVVTLLNIIFSEISK